MKTLLLLSFGFIASALCSNVSKAKVFTKPLGLDTQDLCARMPDGVLIADSDDCRLFYYCLNNEAEPVRCRTGYYFDKETSYCLPGDCPSGTVTYCNVQEESFTRINGKCNSFNICHNGILVHLECPIGTYFNDYMKGCIAIDNNVHHQCACIMPEYTALANEHNCHSYFVCTDGKAVSQVCQRGYFFNEHLNTCVPEVRGQCSTNPSNNEIYQVQAPSKPVKPPKDVQYPKPETVKPQKPSVVILEPKPETIKPFKPSIVIKDPTPFVVTTHIDNHKTNPNYKETENYKQTADKVIEINNEHKGKHTEKHNNKPTVVVSQAEKQEFLDNIREQLITKNQHIKDVHNMHKDKVDVYEKCVLTEEKVKTPDQPKPEHQNIKPIMKDNNINVKPNNKRPSPSDDKVNGVYNKLNSKFQIP